MIPLKFYLYGGLVLAALLGWRLYTNHLAEREFRKGTLSNETAKVKETDSKVKAELEAAVRASAELSTRQAEAEASRQGEMKSRLKAEMDLRNSLTGVQSSIQALSTVHVPASELDNKIREELLKLRSISQ